MATTFAVQSPAAAYSAAGMGGPFNPLPIPLERQAEAHLWLLAMHNPGAWIELRAKRIGAPGMVQAFFRGHRALDAARAAVDMGAKTDVYVGVVPRAVRSGGKDALVKEAHWLWAECDNEAAVVRALKFHTPPPLVVMSSPGKAHCYWPMAKPMTLALVERANRRLTAHLGADPASCDAARILRVAGTENHKRGEARPVRLVRFDMSCRPIAPGPLLDDLPDPKKAKPLPVQRPRRPAMPADADAAYLRTVEARHYIPTLSGRDVYHDMVTCPFHNGGQERTPSLHISGPSPTLWHCFGCAEGGDIYTFAGRMWGLDSSRDFVEILNRLKAARL